MRQLFIHALVISIATILSGPAHAQPPLVQTWTNGSGNFIWNTSSANWSGAGTTWVSGNGASFGSTGAGAITLASELTAWSLSFTANGYVLNSGSIVSTSGYFDVESGISATINSNISYISTDVLYKSGSGTLILGGDNTYTGQVAVTGGTLVLTSPYSNNLNWNEFRGSEIYLENGTGTVLKITATSASARYDFANRTKFQFVDGGETITADTNWVTFGNFSFETFGGPRSNINGNSMGMMNLNGNDAYFVVAPGTDSTSDLTISLPIIGTNSSLIKYGAGRLTLSGANSYSGITRISDGVLTLGSSTALGSTGTIFLVGGTLQYSAGNTTDYSNRISTEAGQLYIVDTNGQSVTWASALTSPGGELTKSGSGTLRLSGNNTFNGGIYIDAGTLNLDTPNHNTYTGDQININGASTLSITQSGGFTRYDFNATTFNFNATGGGTISTGTGLNWVAMGNWTFNTNGGAANTISGASQMNLGGSRSITFNISDGNAVNDLTVSVGMYNTTGSLTKNGNGTLRLSGANSYTGGLTVNSGTVNLTGSNTLGAGNIRVNSAILTITGGGSVSSATGSIGYLFERSGAVNVGGGVGNSVWNNSSVLYVGESSTGTLNITGGGTVSSQTFQGVGRFNGVSGTVNVGGGIGASVWSSVGSKYIGVFGNGTVNITGGGTVTNLDGFIGYLAGSNGTVTVGGGAGSAIWNNSGVLSVGDSGTGTLIITGGGIVSSNDAYFGYAIGSNGTVTVGGGIGTAIWNNSGSMVFNNDGTGTLYIASGGIVTTATIEGGNPSSSINFSGGTLSITSTDTASNKINLLSSVGTINTPNPNVTFTVTSDITGPGGLAKTGPGTLTLSGNNTFSGGMNIERGTVSVANDLALGGSGGVVTVGGLGKLSYTASVTTVSGRIFDLTTSVLQMPTGTTLTFNNATVAGGNLRGQFATQTGTSSSLTGFTLAPSYSITLNGNDSIAFANINGSVTTPATRTTTMSAVTLGASGSMTVGGTVNASEFLSYGTIQLNAGGTLNHTVSNLTLGGGSRTFIATVGNTTGTKIDLGGNSLVVAGGYLVNNGGGFTSGGGVRNGSVVVDYGGRAKGAGYYSSVFTQNGGVFSPGNSPGNSEQGATFVNSGGALNIDIDAAGPNGTNGVGAAGAAPGWGRVQVYEELRITASASSKFTITLTSQQLGGASVAGPVSNFDATKTHKWEVIQMQPGALLFNTLSGGTALDPSTYVWDSTAVTVDTGAFQNNLAGGSFSTSFDLNGIGTRSVYVNFSPNPVPEPGTLLGLSALGLLCLQWYRRGGLKEVQMPS